MIGAAPVKQVLIEIMCDRFDSAHFNVVPKAPETRYR